MTAGEAGKLTDRPGVLDGPFTTPQLLRLDEALRLADRSTGLTFSVYVGDLDEPVRGHAEKLHGQLADPDSSVLIAISPNQRVLEIVTGTLARKRIPTAVTLLRQLRLQLRIALGVCACAIVRELGRSEITFREQLVCVRALLLRGTTTK